MRRLFFIIWLLAVTSAPAVELQGSPKLEVSSSNAVVHWQTDVSSGTKADITPHSASVTIPDNPPGTSHTARFTGLRAGVTYTVTVGSARVWLATNTFTATGSASVMPEKIPAAKTEKKPIAPSTQKIWGNPESLPDHFARHGADFHAKNADDYARLSWEFLQRAKTDGLPAKRDDDGTLRIFDPRSGTFAAYNRDGTTKTFFKPGSRDYFERQPGQPVKLAPKK